MAKRKSIDDKRVQKRQALIDKSSKFDTYTTLVRTAVDLYLVRDTGEDGQIMNSRISFRGSIVGARMKMSDEELREQNIHVEVADHLAKFHIEHDETEQSAVA